MIVKIMENAVIVSGMALSSLTQFSGEDCLFFFFHLLVLARDYLV